MKIKGWLKRFSARFFKKMSQTVDKREIKMKEDKQFISYKKIANALLETMESNIDEVGRELIVPHEFIIHLNPANIERRKSYEDVLVKELKEEIKSNAKRKDLYINPEKVTIQFLPDAGLEIKDVKVVCPAAVMDRQKQKTLVEEGANKTVVKPDVNNIENKG